ncbi:cytochrome P450 [[Mycobacterium] nativiensis]|uniref:Cytochrome P450 n=1 Tax=[Mycobacterium] nativiensis TaxID=2855503 RepID=A0ABU5Y167_9MYCO|nr:cytochrome P450 [Mycolicibacter sp. MYC340]MEB3033994.1 cytochrome P450 [Mycolicibacter sp. MYC340]
MTVLIDGADIDFGTDELPDLHGTLRALRSRGPYARTTYRGMPAVVLLTNELVAAGFKDDETFPAAAMYNLTTLPVMGKTMQCMAGQEHRTNRALVSGAFRRSLMATYTAELLEPIAHRLVDDFAGSGTADLTAEFTRQFPLQVTSAMLGLPMADWPKFAGWAHDLFFYPTDPEAALRASKAFTEYLKPFVAEKRSNPADDLVSKLVTAEIDGVRLTDEEIYVFTRLLFPAGVDTTYPSLGNLLWALLTHPEQLDHLRANPQDIRWAVQEAMRWEPGPAIVPRIAPTDLTWRGIEMSAGTWVLLAIAAANRDPQVYPDPNRFDIGRHAVASVSFGNGPHVCLGQFLALAQLETAVRVLLDRLPGLRLVEPESVRIAGLLGPELRGPSQLRVAFDPEVSA